MTIALEAKYGDLRQFGIKLSFDWFTWYEMCISYYLSARLTFIFDIFWVDNFDMSADPVPFMEHTLFIVKDDFESIYMAHGWLQQRLNDCATV